MGVNTKTIKDTLTSNISQCQLNQQFIFNRNKQLEKLAIQRGQNIGEQSNYTVYSLDVTDQDIQSFKKQYKSTKWLSQLQNGEQELLIFIPKKGIKNLLYTTYITTRQLANRKQFYNSMNSSATYDIANKLLIFLRGIKNNRRMQQYEMKQSVTAEKTLIKNMITTQINKLIKR